MIASLALLSCFLATATAIGFDLSLVNDLYVINGFIHGGVETNYGYSTMTATTFMIDTFNRKSFIFNKAASCTNCPTTYTGVASGLFQHQPHFGLVGFGHKSKVFGKQGVTEIGIASTASDSAPVFNWLQQTIAVTRATNVNAAYSFSGNLALGRWSFRIPLG